MLQIQPRFQPLYRNIQTDLKQIHTQYYPDLTDEEFALSKENQIKVLYERGKLLQITTIPKVLSGLSEQSTVLINKDRKNFGSTHTIHHTTCRYTQNRFRMRNTILMIT